MRPENAFTGGAKGITAPRLELRNGTWFLAYRERGSGSTQLLSTGELRSLETLVLNPLVFAERQVHRKLKGVIVPCQISRSFGTGPEF